MFIERGQLLLWVAYDPLLKKTSLKGTDTPAWEVTLLEMFSSYLSTEKQILS